MRKWLEPAIEQRILEVSETCEDATTQNYNELMEQLEVLKETAPNSWSIAAKIENMFVLKTRTIVEISYKLGFNDGMYVGKKLK